MHLFYCKISTLFQNQYYGQFCRTLKLNCLLWRQKTAVLKVYTFYVAIYCTRINKNRIYIRGEFTRKKCKTVILLYCFHTGGVLHIFALNNLLGLGTSFYRKSKINIKRKPNYEIGWFHNWPIIISHRLYAFHFTNDDFPFNHKSNDVFIHLIHFIKFI